MLWHISRFNSFFLLNNIPYICIYVFFIHSSVDEHLACFHLCTTWNNAVNTAVHVAIF